MNINEKMMGLGAKSSVIRELFEYGKKRKAEIGDDKVFDYSIGNPSVPAPAKVSETLSRLIAETDPVKLHGYTSAAGDVGVRTAIANYLNDKYNAGVGMENIYMTVGAAASLTVSLTALVNPGDEVIVLAPFFPEYRVFVERTGATLRVVQSDPKDFQIDFDALSEAINEKTKCVLLNSPCNPTGVVYSKEELEGLARVAEKYGVEIISDEIYEKLVFEGEKHVSIASLSEYAKNHTIVINGVSKTYAMTGWRIGYMACPTKEVASAVAAMQGHTTSNACSFAQYASAVAISGGTEFIDYMTSEFDKRRRLLVKGLGKIDGIKLVYPKGAFYVFANVSAFYGKQFEGQRISGSVSFADALLKRGVAVIPGLAFGDDDSIRLAYTVSCDDIEKGVRGIERFISELV